MSLKKLSRNLQCGGNIIYYWLKHKIFASQQKNFVTIASAVLDMKILLKQHRLRRKNCHWGKLVMVERWKSNHPFGIKLEIILKSLVEEFINRIKVLFVADVNRFSKELVNDLTNDESDVTTAELQSGIKTELTYSCSNFNQITPSGMSQRQSCSEGLAFDNYERFIETLSEKYIMHEWYQRNSVSDSFRYIFFTEEFFTLKIFVKCKMFTSTI